MAAAPKLSERANEIVRAAIRDGQFVSTTKAERAICQRIYDNRNLSRDKISADLWFPTKRAIELYGEKAELAAPPVDEASKKDRTVARRRIDTIDIGYRLRQVDPQKVEALKPSIAEIGLKTPITVQGKPSDERVNLSAGAHRLETMRQLGEVWIDCIHEDVDDLDRELWEIDENLCRAELTAADRALFVFRRKEIYLIKYPETAHGTPGVSRQVGDTRDRVQTKRFTSATAMATGQSERAVQRDAERGEKIVDEALHRIRGTRLNSGSFLDKLKHVHPERQVLYVEAALAEERQKASEVKENRRALSEVRHTVRLAHMSFVQVNGAAKAGQVELKYPVIYADPPWKFGVQSEITGRDKSADNHYPTMPTDEICALWEEIGAPAKQDAVLFLWATNPMLPDALKVMQAWGFSYVHHWIWDKEVAGTGYWGRDRHELLLIGRRGNPAAPLPGTQPHTVHREAKGRHSAKPDYFAETIERLYPDMPRLEMFCRSPRPGWAVWGLEAVEGEET